VWTGESGYFRIRWRSKFVSSLLPNNKPIWRHNSNNRALPDFKPKRTRYESVNYGISNLRKSTPRFIKSPNLVLIRFVLIEIQRFKNVKINREVMYDHPRAVFGQRPDGHTLFVNFDIFKWLYLAYCVGSIYTKRGDFLKLGPHFMTMWIMLLIP